MKKILSLILAFSTILCLCACGSQPLFGGDSADAQKISYDATDADIAYLEELYSGRTAYHGELHDHSDSGGRSDGKQTLSVWKRHLTKF